MHGRMYLGVFRLSVWCIFGGWTRAERLEVQNVRVVYSAGTSVLGWCIVEARCLVERLVQDVSEA